MDVSPGPSNSVTHAVKSKLGVWKSPPLGPMYPVVFFDLLCLKMRENGTVRNQAVNLAVLCDGTREIPGPVDRAG